VVVVTFGTVVVLVVDVTSPAPPAATSFEPNIEGAAALAADPSPAMNPLTISAAAPANESRALLLSLATSTDREDRRRRAPASPT